MGSGSTLAGLAIGSGLDAETTSADLVSVVLGGVVFAGVTSVFCDCEDVAP